MKRSIVSSNSFRGRATGPGHGGRPGLRWHHGNGGWRRSGIVAKPKAKAFFGTTRGIGPNVRSCETPRFSGATVDDSRGEPSQAARLRSRLNADGHAQASIVGMASSRPSGELSPEYQPQQKQPHADVL